ncbi:unnamed protein product, partial [Iphiclides podalirius]
MLKGELITKDLSCLVIFACSSQNTYRNIDSEYSATSLPGHKTFGRNRAPPQRKWRFKNPVRTPRFMDRLRECRYKSATCGFKRDPA